MPDKSPDIWIPLYIGDYLGKTMHLSTVEHGAYLLLIFAYWKNGGPIPCEDRKLAAICRMSLSEFSAIRSTIAEFFTETDGLWKNSRADKEIAKWSNFKEGKAFGAAIANLKKNGNPIPERFAERYAERLADPPLSVTPSPSPLSSPIEKTHISEFEEEFEKARQSYPGKKRGHETEWKHFLSKNKTRLEIVVPLLLDGVEKYRQQIARDKTEAKFIKHFQGWITEERWTQEESQIPKQENKRHVPSF